MMDKHIRSMIDEIFSEMKMSPENLALRDELMANAQARYEDSMAQGMTQQEAFAEVAASLEDVQGLLDEMNRMDGAQETGEETAEKTEKTEEAEEPAADAAQDGENPQGKTTDLGEALNKAFGALGDFGQAIMPEAKKLVRQMDDATGGMIGSFGRAAKKGMRQAKKAADDMIDKASGEKGELVFDFGPRKTEEPEESESDKLRREADGLCAEADMKAVTGDEEGAEKLREQAEALRTQADMLEQAQAMEEARLAAEQATQATQASQASQASQEEAAQPLEGEDGEIDEDALSRAVDEAARDAEEAVRQEAGEADVTVSGEKTFPAAGLHRMDIELDADDVSIEPAPGSDIIVSWEGRGGDPDVRMEQHRLIIRRKNPDVFKTFFSIFKKDGGRFVVRVPKGYAADCKITTTSGDIRLSGVDAGSVEFGTTSGDMRIEPDLACCCGKIAAQTVSGHVTVSARAEDVAVTTVSGEQFISCDANKVSVNAVSGAVHVEGACDEWDIESVSSRVELLCTVAPTRKMDISTVSSSVHVALPGDIRGFVAEMSSVNGHIENEFGPNRYGTCALPIHMDSVNGQLVLTRL